MGLRKRLPQDRAEGKPRDYPEVCLALLRVPWCIWTQSGCRTGMLQFSSVSLLACEFSCVSHLVRFLVCALPQARIAAPYQGLRAVSLFQSKAVFGFDRFIFVDCNFLSLLINTWGFLFLIQKGTPFPKDAVNCFGAVCFKKPQLLSGYGKYFNQFGVHEVCCWAGSGEAGS